MSSADGPAPGSALLQSIAASHPALHSHLTTLISHLIQHKPSHAFQSLEKLSSHILHPSPHTPHPLLSSPPTPTLTTYLTASPYLFNPLPPPPPH